LSRGAQLRVTAHPLGWRKLGRAALSSVWCTMGGAALRSLLLVVLLPHRMPAALLEPPSSPWRGRIEQLRTLLPQGGPGLMGLDDAFVSEKAPDSEPDAVLTPSQAIKGLYVAFNERDADRVASYLTEDCVYEDLLLGPSTVCRGRDAFVNALRFHPAFVSSKLFKDSPFDFPDVVIEVDSVAEGVDTVGVEWHVQVRGEDGNDFPFPLGRGLSQAKVCVETGKIERVVDIAEAPWRIIGVALLPFIQASQFLSDLLRRAVPTPPAESEAAGRSAVELRGKQWAAAAAGGVASGGASLAGEGTLAALFRALDADGSGYLDMAEIGEGAAKIGLPFRSEEDLQTFFSKLDEDGDGRITQSEFVAALGALSAEVRDA